MGIAIFSDEHTSPISPSRIFKASIIDSHNLIPKLMPQAIKSIHFIHGNGEAGSIKEINFAQGSFSSLKYRIDEVDESMYTYKYTLLEGGNLVENLEKISYEVKLEENEEGGSISKVTSKYYTKGDFELKEEDIKAGKQRVLAMYKVVEDYLIHNPQAYL